VAGAALGFKFNRKSLVGVTVYTGVAGIFSYFLHDEMIRSVVPWLLLLLVIPITHLCGRLSAVLGATLATFIFALFLFPPIGKPTIRNKSDEITLISFPVAAIVVAYLCLPGLPLRKQAKSRL
jgi:K+-sensing histidine kinase KdpD